MNQLPGINPLLNSFENLGALSKEYGLVEIKPFKDWKGSSWREKIFKFRLCNSGEVLDILNLLNGFTPEGKEIKIKHEILVRSIYTINDQLLVTPEEVVKYNEMHKTNLSTYELLVFWIRNLEKIVIDRLDSVYVGLQYKQNRVLQGIYLCEVCGKEYKQIPDGSKKIKYALAELICTGCLHQEDINLSDFDLEDFSLPNVEKEQPLSSKSQEDTSPDELDEKYKCKCGEEFEDLENFMSHRQDCPKAEDPV